MKKATTLAVNIGRLLIQLTMLVLGEGDAGSTPLPDASDTAPLVRAGDPLEVEIDPEG